MIEKIKKYITDGYQLVCTVKNNLCNSEIYNEMLDEIEQLEKQNIEQWKIIQELMKERDEAINIKK